MIRINLDKAKEIAHEKRRLARSEEFAPLDVRATIPSEAVAAEEARASVRVKYADMQLDIDATSNIDELKIILTS